MRSPEHDEQKALFAWAQIAKVSHPVLDSMYAIPNGGHRHKATAAKLKAEGVKAGVPDVCLPYLVGIQNPVTDEDFRLSGGDMSYGFRYSGALYIEMKAPANKITGTRKGTVSKSQKEWIERLRRNGNTVVVAYGWEDAREHILAYLEGRTMETKQ